ncbi:hypothetical protein MKI84_17935, partial [Ancylobacter sp. A5.8]|uniref:hypothetical protein n=1 Tax=Ancylobacter gelatini TaxID=2919920 RepID=UPI001F4E69B7
MFATRDEVMSTYGMLSTVWNEEQLSPRAHKKLPRQWVSLPGQQCLLLSRVDSRQASAAPAGKTEFIIQLRSRADPASRVGGDGVVGHDLQRLHQRR